jgi:signal transduction histidine kinase
MPSQFSTGSAELDRLLEELRAGDNVVFYTPEEQDYLPFVASLLHHVQQSALGLVYVRSAGLLDAMIAPIPGVRTLDLAELADGGQPLQALEQEARQLGYRIYYLFEPLHTLLPWFGNDEQLCHFFLTICPLLFQYGTVAYWNLVKGAHSLPTLAAIKDCTQVFLQVDRLEEDLLITPAKAWGRYSEALFRPHRITLAAGQFHVYPLPINSADQQAYTEALAGKNRELAEIRDALDHSNQELKQRNRELDELNEQLSEQSRLYQSLRANLDHLLALQQAGQVIGSTLVVDQVRRAIATAALRLFDLASCRLLLQLPGDEAPFDLLEGTPPPWWMPASARLVARLRRQVQKEGKPLAQRVGAVPDAEAGSLAMAPILVRGACLGTLEVYATDARLDTSESLTLLSYLASEASIALDNAHLYREVETQGQQLRSYVENFITNEEQDSRRLAFDLHDGLVQLIVASYQHLQTAQAWRGRNPGSEELEIGQSEQLLRRAIYEARRLIGQLRPAGLDDFGLVHALRLYVAQLATEADWQVTLEVDPDWGQLPPALEAAIFRIVQEATTNARKYAEAPRVEIRLQALREARRVSIRDWGKGFDAQEVLASSAAPPAQSLHMGLIGIRERARLWGGQCAIRSKRGRGTTIEVTLPSHRAAAPEERAKG